MLPSTAPSITDQSTNERREAEFHDEWADAADPDSLDIDAIWSGSIWPAGPLPNRLQWP